MMSDKALRVRREAVQTQTPDTYYRVLPRSIGDRGYWSALRAEPRHAALFVALKARAARTPAQPSMPPASAFLAARRHNDRALLDRHWADRAQLAALALRRAVAGLDTADPDDRLLDWLWAF